MVTQTTKWYKDKSNSGKLWIGLEVYDKRLKSLSSRNMIDYDKAAIKEGQMI